MPAAATLISIIQIVKLEQDGVNRHPDVQRILSTRRAAIIRNVVSTFKGLRWQSPCRGSTPNFFSNIALGVLDPTDVPEVAFTD